MFSVVIPIYNSRATLERCLTSLLKQSYKDFEAIIIDDGSIDDGFDYCKGLAAREDRFEVYQMPHLGVSAIRQYGITLAKGNWIVFLDSDDYLPDDGLKSLAESISNNSDCDIVVGNYCIDNNGSICSVSNCFESKYSYIYQFLSFGDVNTSLWGKAIRKSVLSKSEVSFEKGVDICEDYLFLATLFLYTDRIVFVSDTVYYWTIGSDHCLTRSRFTDFATKTKVLEQIEFRYSQHNKEKYLPAINRAKFNTYIMYAGSTLLPDVDVLSKPVFSLAGISNKGLSNKELVIKLLLQLGLRRLAVNLYSKIY